MLSYVLNLRAYVKAFDGPFYKQLILTFDTQNKQFIHHGYLYSATIICLCSHFCGYDCI